MEAKEEKKNYSNRRKTFHFSQKNDDLLQYLNQKDTKEQSIFIMRLIREEMEREKNGDPLVPLQTQLNQALEELNHLKEKLANPTPVEIAIQERLEQTLGELNHLKNKLVNPTPVEVTTTAVEGSGMDEETINRLFVMLADIKHSNESNFNDLKNALKGAQIEPSETEEPQEEEMSDEEFDDLFDDELDF